MCRSGRLYGRGSGGVNPARWLDRRCVNLETFGYTSAHDRDARGQVRPRRARRSPRSAGRPASRFRPSRRSSTGGRTSRPRRAVGSRRHPQARLPPAGPSRPSGAAPGVDLPRARERVGPRDRAWRRARRRPGIELAVVLSEMQGRRRPGQGWIEGVLARRPMGVIAVFSDLDETMRAQLKARASRSRSSTRPANHCTTRHRSGRRTGTAA